MKIEIFGTGCAKCRQTEQVVRQFVQDHGIEATVVKVSDLEAIFEAGVLITPAVRIDGKLVAWGQVPQPDQMQQWF